MLYDEYNKLTKQYRKRIKHIKYRSYRPLLNKEDGSLIGRIPCPGNYDLFFGVDGLLRSAVEQKDDNRFCTFVFEYNYHKLIKRIYGFESFIDFPRVKSEFGYYPDGRLKSEKVVYPDDLETGDRIELFEYVYENNVTTINWKSNSGEDCQIIKIHNEKLQIIEEKFSRGSDLIIWEKTIYDDKGREKEIISLDEAGEPDGRMFDFEYFRNECLSYRNDEKINPYTRRFIYQWNEKEDWTEKIGCNDDKPIFMYTREIEYHKD